MRTRCGACGKFSGGFFNREINEPHEKGRIECRKRTQRSQRCSHVFSCGQTGSHVWRSSRFNSTPHPLSLPVRLAALSRRRSGGGEGVTARLVRRIQRVLRLWTWRLGGLSLSRWGGGAFFPLGAARCPEIAEPAFFEGAIRELQRDLRRPAGFGLGHAFHDAHGV